MKMLIDSQWVGPMEFSGTQSVYLQGPTRFRFGQTSSVWREAQNL